MQVRKALPGELDEIFRMGFDAWGEGKTLEAYLEECRRSKKYLRGRWYVLTDENGTLRSSLIRYSLSADTCGIGSIATQASSRGEGHASTLISRALKQFENEGFDKAFLFSDIGSGFYERFGFLTLPRRHQPREGTVCMVRGIEIESIDRDAGFRPPDRF